MPDASFSQTEVTHLVDPQLAASHSTQLAGSARQIPRTIGSRDRAEAINQLIRHYERSAYLLALAIAGKAEMAEKIAFEAMYRLWAALMLDARTHEVGFRLLQIVVAVGRDLIGLAEVDADSQWEDPTDAAADLSDLNAHDDALQQTLTLGLQALPQRQRIVIVLRDCLHFTSFEVSSLIGFSRNEVTEALARARFALCRSIRVSRLSSQPALNSDSA